YASARHKSPATHSGTSAGRSESCPNHAATARAYRRVLRRSISSVRIFGRRHLDVHEAAQPVRAVWKRDRRPCEQCETRAAIRQRDLLLALDRLETCPEVARGYRGVESATRFSARRRVAPRLSKDRIATEHAL